MSIEITNIEMFSIRLLAYNAALGSLIANAKNKEEILTTFEIMKKDLLTYLLAAGASEEIVQYAKRQTSEIEALVKWDGISQRKHLH